jgi:predicted nucleic acid-binding protein
MSVRSFLDTNVLVYTDDADAPRKKETALDLVESASIGGWGVVSTQVLQRPGSSGSPRTSPGPRWRSSVG